MSTANANIVASLVNDDFFTFAVDNELARVVKIEYSGEIVDTLSLFSQSTPGVPNKFDRYSIVLDQNESIRVLDQAYYTLYKITTTTLEVVSSENLTSSKGKQITMDLNNNVIVGTWESVAVDDNNRVYTVENESPNKIYVTDLSSLSTSNTTVFLQDYITSKEEIVIYNKFTEDITEQTLLTNSTSARAFNPQEINICKDNFLYVSNDTSEIIKLQIYNDGRIGFEEHVTLFGKTQSTGVALSSFDSSAINTISFSLTLEADKSDNTFKDFFWVINPETQTLFKLNEEFETVDCFFLPNSIDPVYSSVEDRSAYSFNLPPATTYDWHRKFVYIPANGNPNNFTANVYTNDDTKTLLGTPLTLADGQWYHLALTYDQPTGEIKFYLDNVLVDSSSVTPGLALDNFYNNGITLGATKLRTGAINSELDCSMYSFDGRGYDSKIYDTALTQGQLAQLVLDAIKMEDVEWNMQTSQRQFIEQIERFFKHRVPGNASQMYNIRLVGLGITDPDLQKSIEDVIKNSIERVVPAYATLYNIEWDNK